MSEDIDFTEIDDLMAAMEDDNKTKKSIAAEVAADRPVLKKKISKPAVKVRPKSSVAKTKPAPQVGGEIIDVRVKNKPAPATPKIESKPNPKTGHYMDFVHPMSDMAIAVRPDRKAPPIVITKTVATEAISLVSPTVNTDIADITPPKVKSPAPEEDDILAEIFSETEVTIEAEPDDDEPDELDRLADELSYNDIETPFLENVKVEKRPLGGGEATEREIKLKELSDAEANKSIDRAAEEAAGKAFISDKDHIEWAKAPKNRAANPAKHSPTKKPHRATSILLYVLLIILLIILGGAIGVLAYFSGLLERLI